MACKTWSSPWIWQRAGQSSSYRIGERRHMLRSVLFHRLPFLLGGAMMRLLSMQRNWLSTRVYATFRRFVVVLYQCCKGERPMDTFTGWSSPVDKARVKHEARRKAVQCRGLNIRPPLRSRVRGRILRATRHCCSDRLLLRQRHWLNLVNLFNVEELLKLSELRRRRLIMR